MFAVDSRTNPICPANLSAAALPVAPFAVLTGADGAVDVTVFVLARVALRCLERCEARTGIKGDVGWRNKNDGNHWTRLR